MVMMMMKRKMLGRHFSHLRCFVGASAAAVPPLSEHLASSFPLSSLVGLLESVPNLLKEKKRKKKILSRSLSAHKETTTNNKQVKTNQTHILLMVRHTHQTPIRSMHQTHHWH